MSYLDRIFETTKEVVTIPNKVIFSDTVTFSNGSTITEPFTFADNVTLEKAIAVTGTSAFTGAATFAGAVTVGGAATFNGGASAVRSIAAPATLAADVGALQGQFAVGAVAVTASKAAAAVIADVQLPSGATLSAGTISGLAITGDLGGTHTGNCAAISVAKPEAGTWDFFLDFGGATGVVEAESNQTIAVTHKIKCRVNGTTFYLAGASGFSTA